MGIQYYGMSILHGALAGSEHFGSPDSVNSLTGPSGKFLGLAHSVTSRSSFVFSSVLLIF